jgi:hypothetical protein
LQCFQLNFHNLLSCIAHKCTFVQSLHKMPIKIKPEIIYAGVFICVMLWVIHLYHEAVFVWSLNIGGMEEANIYYSKVLREKGSLYFDTYHFPYSVTLYTPGYFYVTNFVQQISGISANDIRELYVSGRFINFIFIVLSSLLIVGISKIQGFSLYIGLFSACLFLFHIPEHAYAARPDAMKDFLFIFSMLALVRYQKQQRMVYWWSSILFSILAVYVKQDAVIYLSALWFSFAVLYRNSWYIYGTGLFWTLTTLIALVIQHSTNGYFFDNIIFSNVEFSMDFLPRWWRDIQTVGGYSLLPFALIAYSLFKIRSRELLRWSMISLLFGLLAVLTSIKFGASINYFTSYFIVLSLTMGLALKVLIERAPSTISHFLGFSIMVLTLMSNIGAMDHLKSISERVEPDKIRALETVGDYLMLHYPDKKVLALDQAFAPYLPYEMAFKGFHLVFQQLLYSKFGFDGTEKIYLNGKSERIDLQKIIIEVDCLVLEDNDRSDEIYRQFYADAFKLDKKIAEYNVYLKE